MFAGDLSVFKKCPSTLDNSVVKADMAVTRSEVHTSAKRKRVLFDLLKEHVMIIHPVSGDGDDSKCLETLFDEKLSIKHAIVQTLSLFIPKSRLCFGFAVITGLAI